MNSLKVAFANTSQCIIMTDSAKIAKIPSNSQITVSTD